MRISDEVQEIIRRHESHEDVPILIIHAAIRAIIAEEGLDSALEFLWDLQGELSKP